MPSCFPISTNQFVLYTIVWNILGNLCSRHQLGLDRSNLQGDSLTSQGYLVWNHPHSSNFKLSLMHCNAFYISDRHIWHRLYARITCWTVWKFAHWPDWRGPWQSSNCGFWFNRTLHYLPLSVRSSSVTGVTYQLFSIFWRFIPWKPYIFWMHII